ncbi:MAG TPA: T9SS type A sorting domain-containing protein [Caldithrix abyssi]|uniref:T9SS type A sorting domain-containing protein n=1 Tax=Caldithrix abyssi TaxID=187145 RepID=A0A7V5UFK7_CALAY|nr:T9SS type A sorting domain-containing protein [Caldithrix abyssi]
MAKQSLGWQRNGITINPSIRIRVSLPQASLVDLSIFDVNGRKVKQLLTGNKPAGIYEVVFDGSNLASGVYIYRLQANDFTAVKRMLLVK